jgi:uncharacterized protein (TIGR02599 family)
MNPITLPQRTRRPLRRGFTLIELMISTAVLSMILIMVFQMLKGMQTTWKRTRQDVGEFKDARQAFEEITRRVSQATLNTYYSYRYEEMSGRGGVKIRVGREFIPQSELHFVCGPAETLGIAKANSRQVGQRYTHAVFFQAPFGFCIDEDKQEPERLQYEKMNGLMNSWGYFVEFNTDELDRPQFLNQLDNSPKPRPRYRLMEFRQPTEYLQIYKLNLREMDKNASQEKLYQWFNDGNYSVNSEWNTSLKDRDTEGFFRTTRVVSENIIAMILHPRESDEKRESDKDELAPDYHFDSRRFQWEGSGTLATRTRHQLPPVIDITFVAVDEASFNAYTVRKGIKTADDDPMLVEKDLFTKAKNFRKDLKTLEDKLTLERLDFRTFNTSLRIRESKWIEDSAATKP